MLSLPASLDPAASGHPPDFLDPSTPDADDFFVQVDRRIRIAYNELDPITYFRRLARVFELDDRVLGGEPQRPDGWNSYRQRRRRVHAHCLLARIEDNPRRRRTAGHCRQYRQRIREI